MTTDGQPGADGTGDGEDRRLPTVAILGLGLAAAVALFGLPALRAWGLSFTEAFWLLGAVEIVAALGIAGLILRSYSRSPSRS